jgi:excinuclease ABC subunit A
MTAGIELYGCHEGNLKGIDVKLPYNKLIAITGVSGSGKSSLAFKTIFAEGRRRIIESLDPRESYFLSRAFAPKVDMVLGLPPAIAIRQTQHIRSPKSTLGSISHINSFIFLLFATCGDIPCNSCAQQGQKIYNPPHTGKCKRCGHAVSWMQPGAFSNQSPVGMCQECGGMGVIQDVDETLVYPDQNLSIAQGGLAYGGPKSGSMKGQFFKNLLAQFGYSLDTPIKDLSQEAKVALLFGVKRSRKYKVEFPGIIPIIMKGLKETKSELVRSELERFVVETTCPLCNGLGIGPLAASVLLDGSTIMNVQSMDLRSLVDKLQHMKFGDVRDEIAAMPLNKAIDTGKIMLDMGIGYLTLSRKTASLSGGEMHRARMAAQLATQISGVVYVLDEPSTGLHAEEIGPLVTIMRRLRDIGSGNTVIIVEHDEEIIGSSDHIIELGPGPARNGGQIVFEGSPSEIVMHPESATGAVLISTSCAVKRKRCEVSDKRLGIRNARSNNLKDVSVDIPLNVLVSVTGISGSGKSSLVFDSLCTHADSKTSRTRETQQCSLVHRDLVGDIVLSDQSPISRSTRSVVATYSQIFSPIRDLYARTEKAKKLRLDTGHFSFNTLRGSCQMCKGYGTITPENPMLGGAEFVCPECGGKRFSEEVLSVIYGDRSIADVLDMDVTEALRFFSDKPAIERRLQLLVSIGLGYLVLGQSSLDISGGEAQRLKLAVDLMEGKRSNALYVLDEPTAGLHARDIQVLVEVLDRLLKTGNSVIVVEHNLHLIWASDYIIEMGPGAGDDGGRIVAEGTPQEIAACDTATGHALQRFLTH